MKKSTKHLSDLWITSFQELLDLYFPVFPSQPKKLIWIFFFHTKTFPWFFYGKTSHTLFFFSKRWRDMSIYNFLLLRPCTLLRSQKRFGFFINLSSSFKILGREENLWWPYRIMAVRVVEFSSGGYKIRKIFALESTYPKEIIEFWVLD